MLESWLEPLLTWLGIGLTPFLLLVIAIVVLFKD